MNMIAVGAYIKTLRERQGITQGDVIEALANIIGRRIDLTTLWRLEGGKVKRGHSDILNGLVEVLGGDPQSLIRLSNDEGATAEDGQQAALAWLSRDESERIERLVENTPPEELLSIISELKEEYAKDSSLVIFLRGALAGWRARGHDSPRRR